MLGKNENWQEKMVTVPCISSLVPKNHILYKVNVILKTSWFREEVRELYCETNDSAQLIEQIQRVARNAGVMPKTVTADAAYATSENYRLLEEMGIDPVIPPQQVR